MLVIFVESIGLGCGLCCGYCVDDVIYWYGICLVDLCGSYCYVRFGGECLNVGVVVRCFFILGFYYDGFIYCGDDFNDLEVCWKLVDLGDYWCY